MKKVIVGAVAVLTCVCTTVIGEEQRAETIVRWLANGTYFESPWPVGDDGTLLPSITSGPTIPNLPGKEPGERYWRELQKQGEILSMCGHESVPFLLESLRHQDFFVRIIAALALERILNVKYIDTLGVLFREGREDLGEKEGSLVADEEVFERDLIRKFSERARVVYSKKNNP